MSNVARRRNPARLHTFVRRGASPFVSHIFPIFSLAHAFARGFVCIQETKLKNGLWRNAIALLFVVLTSFPTAVAQSGVGIGAKMSTLGAGIEVAAQVTQRMNVRGGFNEFRYSRDFHKSGISYSGELTLRSVTANLDFYVVGPLHLSPGLLLYNGNRGSADATVTGGQTFSLGGVTYLSNPANPVTGNGKLRLNKVAPEFLIGFGNLVPRSGRHFTVNFEFGAVYQGPPSVKLNLNGSVCTPRGTNCVNPAADPIVLSNIKAEESKLNHDLSPFKFYPVISLGFGYRF